MNISWFKKAWNDSQMAGKCNNFDKKKQTIYILSQNQVYVSHNFFIAPFCLDKEPFLCKFDLNFSYRGAGILMDFLALN